MKLCSLFTHFRALCSIALLALALIACGGSDSSSETSSDEASSGVTSGSSVGNTTGSGSTETSSTSSGSTSEPSVDSGPTAPADDSSLSTYIFQNSSSELSTDCIDGRELGIFNRSGVQAGLFTVNSGRATLNVGSSGDSGDISCSGNAGGALSAGGITLRYEVSNFVLTLTVN